MVRDGVVVFETPDQLPDGTEVKVEIVEKTTRADPLDDPLFRMTELAVDTGVPELAMNIDDYLYGHLKVKPNE